MPLEYLELADYLLIAEEVLGVRAERLAEIPHLVHLAESALNGRAVQIGQRRRPSSSPPWSASLLERHPNRSSWCGSGCD